MKQTHLNTSITVNGREVPYIIRKSRRAKRAGLVVHPDGRIVATVPYRASANLAVRFVEQHAEWLLKTVASFDRFENKTLARLGRRDYLKHKEQARVFVTARTHQLNTMYDFAFNRISVRDTKTRWGSCTSKKNLNFNYKIIFLTPEQQDYIIVHELCHLKEMNHSKRFWELVARSTPEHTRIRRELKKIL